MFKTGDLLEYAPYLTKNLRKRLSSTYPIFSRCHYNLRCVVLKMKDEQLCIVAPCTIKTASAAAKCFDLAIQGERQTILVCTEKTYIVNAKHFCLSSTSPLLEPQKIIEQIKTKQDERKQQQRIIKKHEAELHQKYKIAIINNDHKLMKMIVDELGYAPIGKGTSKKTEIPQYTHTNPKAFQGGRFSSK